MIDKQHRMEEIIIAEMATASAGTSRTDELLQNDALGQRGSTRLQAQDVDAHRENGRFHNAAVPVDWVRV